MISPARLRTLASASFVIFLALLPFESSPDIFRLVLPALAALLILLADSRDKYPERAIRAMILSSLPRIGFHLAAFVAPAMLLGISLLMLVSPSSDAREQISEVVKRPILFLLLAPALALRLTVRANNGIQRTLLILPLLMGLLSFLSGCFSLDPEESLRLFSKEAGVYFLAFYVALNLLDESAQSMDCWLRAHLIIFGITGFAAVTVAILAYVGPESLFEALLDHDLIRSEFEEVSGRIIRAQLLFGEHNRLASYLLIGLLMTPLLWMRAAGRSDHALAIASALILTLGIFFTGTRGALLAAGVGLIIISASKPKMLVMICIAGLISTLLLPSPLRRQVFSIVNPKTYTESGGNVRLRLEAWENTLEMIRDRPVFGFGYGWTLYEELYKKYNADRDDVEDKPHAHNNLLEITAETGLIGGSLYAAWNLLLGGGLLLAAIRSRRDSPERQVLWAALGLWAGLNVFGMTNYSLRRSVGAAVWIGWALCSSILLSARTHKKLNAEI